jgi:hypothetical protein
MLLTIAAKPFTWLAEEASVGFEDSFFGFCTLAALRAPRECPTSQPALHDIRGRRWYQPQPSARRSTSPIGL